jgi:hypothetical protein
MPRDREAAQDIALYHMEKLNRNNRNETPRKTVKEQLAEAELPSSERRKRMPAVEWYKDARDIVSMSKNCRVSNGLWNWAIVKYKADIEKMRLNGDSYDMIFSYVKTLEMEYINR